MGYWDFLSGLGECSADSIDRAKRNASSAIKETVKTVKRYVNDREWSDDVGECLYSRFVHMANDGFAQAEEALRQVGWMSAPKEISQMKGDYEVIKSIIGSANL